MMDKKRVRLIISGQVQGVFFRASTQQKAHELGLTGWVRNDQGGTVTAEAEGDTDKLDTFIQWCHDGPSHANVDDIKVEWIDPKGETTFEITYQ